MLFVVGMAIFLLWKLFEPRREGQSRTLIDVVAKPALAMAGGITFIGICMIFPQVLGWTLGAGAVFAVIALFRMPAKEKQAIADAIDQPDPESKWSMARLLLAVIIVFAAFFGLLAYYVPD
jgi:predicted MFS family arabinose efflux permease